MAVSDRVSGDALNLQRSAALGEIYREQHWQAPSNATTVHHDNVVASVMHDVLSPAEIMFVRGGFAEQVHGMLVALCDVVEGKTCAAAERLTGRAVMGVFSDAKLAAATEPHAFVLDRVI